MSIIYIPRYPVVTSRPLHLPNTLLKHLGRMFKPQRLILFRAIVNRIHIRQYRARNREVVRSKLPDLICCQTGSEDGRLPN